MHTAGFTPLAYLKSRLLPEAALDITEWDHAMMAVGMGVAAKFEAFCNRSFEHRAAEDEFAGDSLALSLSRYPVLDITAIYLDGAEIEPAYRLAKLAGLIEITFRQGRPRQTLRVAYEGGYWLDPRDGTVVPDGLTALPSDVLESYVAQCQAECEGRGMFHALGLRDRETKAAATPVMGLMEAVQSSLLPHRRFAGA